MIRALLLVLPATVVARRGGASLMHSVSMPMKMRAHFNSTPMANMSTVLSTAEIKELVADGELECDPEVGYIGGAFRCANMTLVNFLDGADLGTNFEGNSATAADGTWVSDIWGWNDPETGDEYALVGMWDGFSIVNITDPRAPKTTVFVNTTDNVLDGIYQLWRDIKIVNDVAFSGSEAFAHGIQAFDLTKLKYMTAEADGSVPTVAADYIARNVSSTHNIVAVPSMDKVIAVGMIFWDPSCPDGSLAIFDVSGEYRAEPRFEYCYDDVGYVHDAQCIKYEGPDTDWYGANICALFAEEEIYIVDLGNGTNITEIANFTYPTYGYVHQGWFSEDHTILYADDELDEILRMNSVDADFSRCYLFDVTDLDYPVQLEAFVTPSAHPSIDHNLYVKDGYIYQAAYTSGARVRKIVDDAIEEVAYFDLEQTCDCVFTYEDDNTCTCDSFLGTWTYFPYFDSGLTIAGGAVEGLFILRPTL